MIFENRPYKPRELLPILGVNRTQFWRVVKRLGVPMLDLGPRCKRFPAAAAKALYDHCHVVPGTDGESRVRDARRKVKAS